MELRTSSLIKSSSHNELELRTYHSFTKTPEASAHPNIPPPLVAFIPPPSPSDNAPSPANVPSPAVDIPSPPADIPPPPLPPVKPITSTALPTPHIDNDVPPILPPNDIQPSPVDTSPPSFPETSRFTTAAQPADAIPSRLAQCSQPHAEVYPEPSRGLPSVTPEIIRASASSTPLTSQDVEALDTTGVANSLRSIGLSEDAVTVLRQNNIIGSVLLLLTDQALKEEIGIKAFGDRVIISKFISQVTKNSSQVSYTSQQQLITKTSTPTAPAAPAAPTVSIPSEPPTDPAVGHRFSVVETETLEYKGELMVPNSPKQSCKEEMLAHESVLAKVVPLLHLIVEDCERIYERTITKRDSAVKLVPIHLSNNN